MKARLLKKVHDINSWVVHFYNVVAYQFWVINLVFIFFVLYDIRMVYEFPTPENKLILATIPLRIFITYALAYILFGDKFSKKK